MIVSTYQPTWKYQTGDWVMEPGLPNHHLRIIDVLVDDNSVRFYLIFDTTMRDGFSDFRWRQADELEFKSKLEARPHADQVPAIVQRVLLCRYVGYSLWSRTDCESLQRWIHTGMEQVRWSPQVWTAIGTAIVGSFLTAQKPAAAEARN